MESTEVLLDICLVRAGAQMSGRHRYVLKNRYVYQKLFAFAGSGRTEAKAGEGFAQVLEESLGIIDIGIDLGGTIWSDGFDLVQLKLVSHVFNDFGLNWPLLIHKSVHKGMLAEKINDTRNSQGVDVDGLDRFRTKNRIARSAGDS